MMDSFFGVSGGQDQPAQSCRCSIINFISVNLFLAIVVAISPLIAFADSVAQDQTARNMHSDLVLHRPQAVVST